MKRYIKILFIILIFCIIGLIFSHPLTSNFKEKLPYAYQPAPVYSEEHLVPGDYMLLYYIYWLFKDYFVTPDQHLFQEPYMFSISSWPRPYEPRGLPSSFLFLIFSFCGNIGAYNCIIILSFILCGLFTFLLAKKYMSNSIAAFTSGLIFTISPFRLTQLYGGHPTGFILFWIPLIIYLYELLWEKKKLIFGWLASLCIFGMAMEEHHMGYYTALFTIIFWLYKYIFCNREKINPFKFIRLLLPIGIGWLAALSYMMYIKLIVISTSIASSGRTFNEISLYSPTIKHIFQRINPDGEKCIYIGIAVSILIITGLLKRIFNFTKEKNITSKFPFLFYCSTFFITLLLSLGPNLKYLPLYRLCYKIIPFFHYPRVPARMFMYTLLAASLLTGYSVKYILESINKKWLKATVTFFIIIFLFLDFHLFNNIGLSTVPKGNKTYDYIKATYPNNPLLEIPLWPGEASWTAIYLYYTTIYKIPLINGYSPFVARKYIDEIFWPLVSINMGTINDKQYKLLKQLNIKYINLHEEAYPQKVNPFPFKTALKNLKRSPYIKFILHDDPIYLFAVQDKPLNKPVSQYTIPSKTGIFYECEYMPHRIGKIIEDSFASDNKTLFANEQVDKPKHLVFGPWQLFPPGKYKLIYRIKLDTAPTKDKSRPFHNYTSLSSKQTSSFSTKTGHGSENSLKGRDKAATLEITTDNGKKQITHKDLYYGTSREYKDYALHFTLDELTPLEFRIIYYGNKPIYADYIYIVCEESNDPIWKYEAEELFHTGREINNAVYVTPKKDPKGIMVFGPYRRYKEGKYRVGFRIKSGVKKTKSRPFKQKLNFINKIKSTFRNFYNRSKFIQKGRDKPSAAIEVVSGYSKKPLARKILENIPTEYKTYYLNINLDKPNVLEFRIDYFQETPIYVDYIEIESIE